MTEPTTSEHSGVGAARDGGSPPWEAPEIVAVAILVAFFVVVIGALATGIDIGTTTSLPFSDPLMNTWNAVQFGTTWAEPLIAIILLGVVGLCWWQVDAWTDGTGADDEDAPTAFGHIRRARRISLWAVSSLIITTVGAIAGMVALVGYDVPAHTGRVVWDRYVRGLQESE